MVPFDMTSFRLIISILLYLLVITIKLFLNCLVNGMHKLSYRSWTICTNSWGHRPPWNMSRFLMETCSFHAENNAEKCRKRRFRVSKFAKFSSPPTMLGAVIWKLVNLLFSLLCFWIFSMVPSAVSFTKIEIRVQKIQMHIYHATFFWYGLHNTYSRTCLLRNSRPVLKDLL